MIAGSRIIDARHHPFDVMFGSALGILCGWGSYRQYFPPVSHTWEKGRAYPIRTWGVPLRQPGGTVGTDGQFYAHTANQRVDRTANAMMDDEEDRQALVGTNMEPMPARGNQTFSSANAPPFHQFQRQHPPASGLGSPGSDEDTDYEHVRRNAGGSLPVEKFSKPGASAEVTPMGNAFRDQIDRNQGLRGGAHDEQDLAFQRPQI